MALERKMWTEESREVGASIERHVEVRMGIGMTLRLLCESHSWEENSFLDRIEAVATNAER